MKTKNCRPVPLAYISRHCGQETGIIRKPKVLQTGVKSWESFDGYATGGRGGLRMPRGIVHQNRKLETCSPSLRSSASLITDKHYRQAETFADGRQVVGNRSIG